MDNSIKLTVKGTPEYLQVCNSTVIAAANIAKLDIESIDDVGVAVIEACKIVSCHGSNCWCDRYQLNIDIKEKTFEIEVFAVGEHILEKCETMCTMCPQEGDLGVAVMNTIMDSVQLSITEEGKKKITMIKNIK